MESINLRPTFTESQHIEESLIVIEKGPEPDEVSYEEGFPLVLMVLIPILSSGLILLILAVVCIRRQTKATASSLTASPLVKMNEAASDEANRVVTASDHTTLQTLKRLSSLHFYAKPWASQPMAFEDQRDQEDFPADEDGENW